MHDTRTRAHTIVLALAALLALAPLAGCLDLPRAEALRAQASQIHSQLDEDARAWESRAGSLHPEDPLYHVVRAQASDARAREAVASEALQRLDDILNEAREPSHPITQAMDVASPLLPPGVRGPALLAVAAGVALARAWRLKAGLASVARGLASAMRDDQEFRACFTRHADTFRAVQTPTAKRVIDESTRRELMVRLPV